MPIDPLPSASLRPVREDDAEGLLAAFCSAPDMARQGGVTDLASARAQVEWLRTAPRRAAAVVDADDTLVGVVVVQVDAENRSGWVSYWLHAARRSQGLASRAVTTVCDRALTQDAGGWGLDRLELGHRVDNPASGGVAQAAGFVVEGREREKFLVGGERVDVLTYGRLRADPFPATPHLGWREI